MRVRQPPVTLWQPAQQPRPAGCAFVAAVMPVCIILAEARVAGMAPADFEDFAIDLHAGRQRLGLGVNAIARQEFRYMHELAAGAVDAHPVFVVQCVVQRIVEEPDVIGDAPPPERRGLADETRLQQPLEIEGRRRIRSEHAVDFVDVGGVAVQQVPVGMVAKVLDGRGDGARAGERRRN